jgi:hypothetical protein
MGNFGKYCQANNEATLISFASLWKQKKVGQTVHLGVLVKRVTVCHLARLNIVHLPADNLIQYVLLGAFKRLNVTQQCSVSPLLWRPVYLPPVILWLVPVDSEFSSL